MRNENLHGSEGVVSVGFENYAGLSGEDRRATKRVAEVVGRTGGRDFGK